MYSLGKLYLDKDSDFFDLKKADSYCSDALKQLLLAEADSPAPFLEYTIGKLYLHKELSFSDTHKAASFLQTAAENGSSEAQYSLGKLYLDTDTPNYNLQKGISYLTSAAKQNNLYACLSLGHLFSSPNYPVYNIGNAENYYLQAINLSEEILKSDENPSLNYSIGQIYLNKELTLYNPSLAIMHLEKAAAQGEAYAQSSLINIYFDKKSAYYNPNAAYLYLETLKNSANTDDKISQYLLGKLHIYKTLPNSSKRLGLEYLQKSALQDYEPAKETLQQEQRFKEQLIARQSFKLILDVFNCLTTENANYENSLNMKAHSKQVWLEELRKSGIEPHSK